MAPLVFNMRQAATYWPPGAADGYGGIVPGTPRVVACRWEDRAVLFRSPSGEEEVSAAVVYPDQELAVKGYLALGDQTATADPRGLAGAREIRQVGKSPALRRDVELNKCWVA